MPSALKFKATIKSGTLVGIDHSQIQWHKSEVIFDVELRSYGFDCKAPGYGAGKHYGSGSLTVYELDDLVVSANDYHRVIDMWRKEKLDKIAEKTLELVKLTEELAALESRP